jgi:hypothetical protein
MITGIWWCMCRGRLRLPCTSPSRRYWRTDLSICPLKEKSTTERHHCKRDCDSRGEAGGEKANAVLLPQTNIHSASRVLAAGSDGIVV